MAPIQGDNLTLEEPSRDCLQDVGSTESSALIVLFCAFSGCASAFAAFERLQTYPKIPVTLIAGVRTAGVRKEGTPMGRLFTARAVYGSPFSIGICPPCQVREWKRS